jgi:hypothetical protein
MSPDLAVGINVAVQALWIATFSVFGKEPAFRHLFQIILVQKFTYFSINNEDQLTFVLFAESA